LRQQIAGMGQVPGIAACHRELAPRHARRHRRRPGLGPHARPFAGQCEGLAFIVPFGPGDFIPYNPEKV
jgi:hypothetical protein